MIGAIQHEAAVGLAAEVEAGAVGPADPVGGVLNADGGRGEKVAPIAVVDGLEERAGFAVGARGDDAVGAVAQLIAHGGQGAAVGVGAGLDPDHGGGAGDEGEKLGAGVGREFVENVADDEGVGGKGIGSRLAGARRYGEGGEGFAGAGGGERAGVFGMVPDVEGVEPGGAEGGEDAATGDAAAAAPVEERGAGGRRPVAQGELAEKGVPFPADAFGEGEIVAGEIGRRLPVGAGGGGVAGEEAGAEAVERGPVELIPVHAVKEACKIIRTA